VLRRDRRNGKLGIPYIKISEGKWGLVRYDLADLDQWVAGKKRLGGPAVQPLRPVVEVVPEPMPTPAPPAPTRPSIDERREATQRKAEALLARADIVEIPDDPFAPMGRSSQPHAPAGYFTG
jgi:hypothetical protein